MTDSPFKIDTYAVIGNPVEHSLSPTIHHAFAKQTQQSLQYIKVLSPLDAFSQTVANFRARGGKGFNITVPFKTNAAELVDEISNAAKLSGAVNTIQIRTDGSLFGDNTDGTGLVTDLIQHKNIQLKGANILIIGAGGAVKGVLPAILREQPNMLVISNRTTSKAEILAQQFAALGNITACEFEQLTQYSFNLIINGTSSSLQNAKLPIPKNIIHKDICCYDMVYAKELTSFLKWCQQHGAEKIYDGMGMLVEQAASTFQLWRGIKPETQHILKQL